MRLPWFRRRREEEPECLPQLYADRDEHKSCVPIWFSNETLLPMLGSWRAVNVGSMRIEPRDDGTFDMHVQAAPTTILELRLLDHPKVQDVFLNAFDLLREVEQTHPAIVPGPIIAKANELRRVADALKESA